MIKLGSKVYLWMILLAITIVIAGLYTKVAYAIPMPPKEQILSKGVQKSHYLPDFSFAGYKHGEAKPNSSKHQVIDVGQHGVIANDGLDDSKALITLLESLAKDNTPTILQFAPGRYIISSIIYFDRNYTVLRGAGSSQHGTEFYFPRPLMYVPDPPELKELRDYLVQLKKIQRERQNNIELPFTQWAWSGGFFWTRIENQRVKQYLDEYEQTVPELGRALQGTQGGFSFEMNSTDKLSTGDVIEIQWLNDKGENGPILKQLYREKPVYIGSHHWSFANLPISRQQVRVSSIKGNTVTLTSPLLHPINQELLVKVMPWEHLHDIGFEHFRMTFGFAKRIAHHVEQGFNGIYLTRLYDGWVNDVRITDADSGILTEESANLTISNVLTDGDKYAHYSVQMGGVHNVLVDNLRVHNRVVHPLSFNTFATKSVYRGATVAHDPVLDQHSGANHQNLFDNIEVDVRLPDAPREYPLFAGGGAKYWKPSHGAYNTFWNINVHFKNGHDKQDFVILNGMDDGVSARLVGVRGNIPVAIEYGPDAYIEATNQTLSVPSLYQFQLDKRLAERAQHQ